MVHYRTLAELDEAAEPAPVGLAAIAAEFSAGAGPVMAAARAGVDVDSPQPGHRGDALVSHDDVWPAMLQPATLAAAGTIDLGSEWGPTTGYALRLTEVVVLLGTGTTLVQIFKNSALGLASLKFQTAATGLWEPARMFLVYGERLVVTSTGGGVTLIPDGERIRLSFLPTYMA